MNFDSLVWNECSDLDQMQCGEYCDCTFKDLDLSSKDLSSYRFIDCTFEMCNLSSALLHGTTFNGVKFEACKMLGLQFQQCNELGLSIEIHHSKLDHSSFAHCDLRKSHWTYNSLRDVDFHQTNLSQSKLLHNDLHGAVFERCDLSKAHLCGSFGIALDPEANQVKGLEIDLDALPGLLLKYQIKAV